MRTVTIAQLALVSFVVAGSCPVSAQEIGDAVKGAAYAEAQCAECHALAHNADRSPVADAPPFRAIANTSGMTRTALKVFFRTPHPTMPNLLIPADQQDNLIAYIMGLKIPR